MLGKIVKLGVFLLVLNAAYQVVPPFVRYQRFKSALQDVALAGKGKTDVTIVNEVMELAGEYSVPLHRDWVSVSRSPDTMHTYIDATWQEVLKPIPGWTYAWIPEVRVDGWHVRRLSPQDVR